MTVLHAWNYLRSLYEETRFKPFQFFLIASQTTADLYVARTHGRSWECCSLSTKEFCEWKLVFVKLAEILFAEGPCLPAGSRNEKSSPPFALPCPWFNVAEVRRMSRFRNYTGCCSRNPLVLSPRFRSSGQVVLVEETFGHLCWMVLFGWKALRLGNIVQSISSLRCIESPKQCKICT